MFAERFFNELGDRSRFATTVFYSFMFAERRFNELENDNSLRHRFISRVCLFRFLRLLAGSGVAFVVGLLAFCARYPQC
jgi:hypothetical protein